MGIDTSPDVRSGSLDVAVPRWRTIRSSMRCPRAGRWRCALLLDGSIGIGGDPESPSDSGSARCFPDRGRLLVETGHPNEPSEDLDVRIETAASSGARGFAGRSCRIVDMATLARTSGFHLNDAWEDDGRYFAQLERISDP